MTRPPSAQRLSQDLAPLFGSNGISHETGTTARTGDWCAIQMLNSTVIAAITENGKATNDDGLLGLTLPAGLIIYNALGITAITLTSGAIRMYNR